MSGGQHIVNKMGYIINRFQENDILLQPYKFPGKGSEKLLSILKENSYDFVAAAGGDGTLNYIVNLLLKNDMKMPLGIIPSGTCNDFAGSLGVYPPLHNCLDTILKGRTAEVDVGLINNKDYFLSTCAGGVFVGVSFNTHSELKKNFGPFAYYLKGLTEVANIKPFRLEVETEKENINEDVLLFLILNGRHGGGFPNLIREADVTDGIMDIVLIKSGSHIDLAGLFFKVLANDSLNDKNVTILRARSCLIKGNADIDVSVDGEKGPSLPLKVEFINKALKVFVK